MSTERNLTGADEAARKELADVVELLAKMDGAASANREMQEKLLTALGAINEKLSTPASGRKGEFEVRDAVLGAGDFGSSPANAKMLQELVQIPAQTDEIRALHSFNDDLFILRELCKPTDVRELKYYQSAFKQMPMFRKAMDTSAGGASDSSGYIPQGFSASLQSQVRLQLRVAALHQRIAMPSDPFHLPIEGADANAYLVTEQGSSDANLASANMVTPSFSSSSPSLTNLTLTSKKLGARITFSRELSEDSLIPILPYVREKLALAMADAQEDATINGDTAGTLDASTPGAAATRAWNGYRKHAPAAATASLGGNTTVDIANLRAIRQAMGIYGYDPSKLAIVTGPAGYLKLLSLKDGSNPSPVQTLDKYGPQATILTGELARVDGIPILVSPKVRENLSTTGSYDGVTTDRTIIACVNRDAFVYGDRRQIGLATKDTPETDQQMLIVMQRVTFANWFAGQPVCGLLYNLKK